MLIDAADDLFALDLALGSAAVQLPGIGLFCLDPATVLPVIGGQLPGAPRLASALLSAPVPPGLQGLSLYWQAVHLRGRQIRWLTNCVETTF